MTSGTDEPRPTGEPPAEAVARPEADPPASSTTPATGTRPPEATQPWRPDPDERDGSQPAATADTPEPDPIRPVPGGGWVYAPPTGSTPSGYPRDDAPQTPTSSPAGGAPPERSAPQPAVAPQPARPASGPGLTGSAGAAAAAPTAATRTGQGGATAPTPARQTGPAPTRAGGAGRTGAPVRKGPRRARLTIRRIDPWSVLRFSFVYSLAGVVVLLVAAVVLYLIVDAMGVIDSVRTFLNDVEGGSSGLSQWLGFGRVMTIAIVLGVVNVVLFTAFATLTAFVYNVCTEIVGGVEVTLTDSASAGATEVASSGGRGL